MRRLLRLECFRLFRDFRLYAGAALLLLLLSYGFKVRHSAIIDITAAMDTSRLHEERQFRSYITQLDSVSNYGKVVEKYDVDPRNPALYLNRAPKFAFIHLNALGILAHGQSDLYNEEVLLTSRFRDPRQRNQDMVNPSVLEFGQFDAAMVLVILFPLFIIALSFNFLSAEKENGTIRLIAIHSGSIKKWIWAKTIVYGIASFLVPWLICMALFMIYNIDFATNTVRIGFFSLILLCYTFLWQSLAVFINLSGRSSAFNAMFLVCLWVAFVFVLPAVSNLIANQYHQVPSRVSFINAVRQAQVEAEKLDSSELANRYFFDHPELVEKKDTVGQSRYAANEFAKQSILSQEIINKRANPVYEAYNHKLKEANVFAGHVVWISPSAAFNKALLELAGTSSQDYFRFTDSATQFRAGFLQQTGDRILSDKELSYEEIINERKFSYQPAGNSGFIRILFAFILYLSILLWAVQKRVKNLTI